MFRHNIVILLALLVAACGGGGGVSNSGNTGVVTIPPEPPVASANINVLMLGNSHTTFNGLPTMLAHMVRAGRPGQTVNVEAPGDFMFLNDRIRHTETLALFRSRTWQFVVLQAQQYSASGITNYPTDAAEEFVRMTRAQGGKAVMFPEWARIGVNETQLVYDIHKRIAQAGGACLAPIGQAWDLSLSRRPTLRLHADDGNHSNANGAFLAALVLYSAITGESPAGLPYLGAFPVSNADQAHMRQVAAETVAQLPPRQYCQ